MGTPERPLSDLGLVSYLGFWTRQLLQARPAICDERLHMHGDQLLTCLPACRGA